MGRKAKGSASGCVLFADGGRATLRPARLRAPPRSRAALALPRLPKGDAPTANGAPLFLRAGPVRARRERDRDRRDSAVRRASAAVDLRRRVGSRAQASDQTGSRGGGATELREPDAGRVARGPAAARNGLAKAPHRGRAVR